MNAQTRRLGISAAIVSAIVLLPCVPAIVQSFEPVERERPHGSGFENGVSPVSADSPGGLREYADSEGDMVQRLFERVCRVPDTKVAPEWFARELFDPAVLKDAQAYVGPSVVGVAWSCAEGSAEARVESMLADKGWLRTGVTEAGTVYTKDEGSCRWANVQVIEVSGHASVTVTYVREEEE